MKFLVDENETAAMKLANAVAKFNGDNIDSRSSSGYNNGGNKVENVSKNKFGQKKPPPVTVSSVMGNIPMEENTDTPAFRIAKAFVEYYQTVYGRTNNFN